VSAPVLALPRSALPPEEVARRRLMSAVAGARKDADRRAEGYRGQAEHWHARAVASEAEARQLRAEVRELRAAVDALELRLAARRSP
jgi:hypothetical protein